MYYIIYKETLVLSKYKLGTSTFKMSADTKQKFYSNFPDPKWWGRVLLFLIHDRYLNQKFAISANLSESLILLSPNLSFFNNK